MKKFLSKLPLIGIIAIVAGVSGCEMFSSDNPSLDLEVKTVETDYVEIGVEAHNLSQLAYSVYTDPVDGLTPTILFKEGTIIDAIPEGTFTIDGLTANRRYYIYFAAKINDSDFFDEVKLVDFTTPDYVYDGMLSLVESYYQGYKVHLKVPKTVKKGVSGVRFTYASIPMYLSNKFTYGTLDMEALITNGGVSTVNDTTIINTPDNEYLFDSNGDLVYDELTEQPIMIHEPIAPGEPTVFFAGEFGYAENAEVVGISGWGPGYYVPTFDVDGYLSKAPAAKSSAPETKNYITDVDLTSDEEAYWPEGSFAKIAFTTKQPEVLDGTVNVDIEAISAIDATISLRPDETVAFYCYTVLDQGTYESVLQLLGGKEEWLQWFVTSYFGMMQLGIATETGNIRFQARDFFYDPLDEQKDYHLLITAMGDESGSSQSFVHKTFTTTERTLPRPEVVVTAVDNGSSEFMAKFNVKAPNKDVDLAYWAANYKRDWMLEINSGATYASLVQNQFSADEVALINSDSGLDVEFPSHDGETTRMAVLAYNAEYLPNELSATSSAVADYTTKLQTMEPHNGSPLFKELVGDWTATASVWVKEYDKDNNLVEYKSTEKAKISIMSEIPVPELTDEVYDIYAQSNWSKEQTDRYYEEFKKQAAIFNDYRLHYRNRLLCLGWFDYDFYNPSRLSTRSAFDLFTATDYNSIDCAMLFYDFGPKWYLDIAEDGTVLVPFSQYGMPPMTNWQGTPFFMSGYNRESNRGYKDSTDDIPGFPVEVSKDKIVIRGFNQLEADGKTYTYYPNAIGGWSEYDAVLIRPVISEITLTRGWNDTKSSASSVTAKADCAEDVILVGEPAKPSVWKSLSKFPERVEYRVVKPHVLTQEMLEEGLRNYYEIHNRK